MEKDASHNDEPPSSGDAAATETASLVLATDPALLSVLHGFVTGMAAAAGLPQRDGERLALAVDEAAANVIEHAYGGDRSRTYTVVWRSGPEAVEVVVRDKGIPFDAARVLPFRLGAMPDETDAAGLGFHLMRSAADSVRLRNLGRGGKEVVLTKRRAVASRADFAPPPAAAAEQPAPAGPVAIRLTHPEEAVEAARCIWRCFEYSYPYEDIFHPDRVRAMIDSGQLVSAVAEAEGSGIVGHVGLKPVPDTPRHMEVGMLAVDPQHRRDGLALRLTRFAVEHAAAIGLDGVFAEAVTTHPGSQAVAGQVGGRPCALLIGEVPVLEIKGFDDLAQRESLVLYCRRFRPRRPVTVRVPPHLEAIVRTLYAEMGLAAVVEAADGGETALPTGPSVLDLDFSRVTARLRVLAVSAGDDLRQRVASAQREAVALRAEVLDVQVPLEDPAAPAVAAAAEAVGARFIGLRPSTANGDLAVFRLLLGRGVDLTALKLFTRTARRLRDGIARGWTTAP